ncbi:MAG TPA: metallophosphoesterase [Pseudomonas xinjiangensis]|uniref:Metallophosphoesterase n=2 Tax=root TaxID=1 RepID=A0A7V1FSQ0_9GAMM|nr:metallophosphoesterase [Halopseudomonas xinjiangensis]HEC48491.1 metallophosphoesterase [Halopseudomonas xinjiangensis]
MARVMRNILTALRAIVLFGLFLLTGCDEDEEQAASAVEVNSVRALLTDPFLQLPTPHSVNVVWFTNFEGSAHRLDYGQGMTVMAKTTRLSRMMEDASSQQRGKTYETVTSRPVYRHEATATGLVSGERVEYRITSVDETGHELTSDTFTLAATPPRNQPLKILLTSDMQSKVNAPANYQRMVETVGIPDAVFFAGDFVNVPDRASEWFDQVKNNEPAFFPSLQGRNQQLMPTFPYAGGEILQHAPLFGTIGNHEVMGRYQPERETYTLNGAYHDPQPRWYAEIAYEQVKKEVNPKDNPDVRAEWIADHSHNHMSFLEIFSFPDDGSGGEAYYAVSLGDVFLISLNISRIWRSWSVDGQSRTKFVEALAELENPEAWGFGEFMFEQFNAGSDQYQWLSQVLQSDAFRQARYKVVLAHQGAFGLGDNTVPVLADPVMQLVEPDVNGGENVTELPFPISADDWHNKVLPRLSESHRVSWRPQLLRE